MGRPRSVILDCDPGIDDALAILLAVASPELWVEAITTVCGNVGVDQATRNALKVLESCGSRSVPSVFMGSVAPLGGAKLGARRVHGANGLGNTDLPLPRTKPHSMGGVDLICSRALAGADKLTLICTGPLTNIAHVIAKAPGIAKIIELIMMGGAVYTADEIEGIAEFNVRSDPEACGAVFASGASITMVSLDVTRKVLLTSGHLEGLRVKQGELAKFIVSICDYSIDFHRCFRSVEGTYLNDPLAVGIAIDEGLGEFEPLCIGVDLEGDRGRTFIKEGPPNVRFLRDVDSERFLDLFLMRLKNLCEAS